MTQIFWLTQPEYYEAISEGLDVAVRLVGKEESVGLADGDQAFRRILAWVWHSRSANAKCEDFLRLDLLYRDIALRLLVGRLDHGVPGDHDRWRELKEHYLAVTKGEGYG